MRKPQPQFLRIRWEDTTKEGGPVTLEAMACLGHRREIALAYPSARGAGGRGEECDLCAAAIPDVSDRSFSPQSARVP